MRILGKFWADVRVQKVAWPRDRWSDFRKLGIKKMRKTWKKKSHEKSVSRSAAVATQSRISCRGGGQIDPPPPPVKIGLTLIRLGGAMMAPLRHIARLLGNARSSRRDTLWQFSFEFPAHFDTKFVTAGGTVPKLRNIVYMHVGPKMAPKCDFVYKINANWVFSLSSYKYAYFYSQLLKLISFWFIVLQKVSATNFGE